MNEDVPTDPPAGGPETLAQRAARLASSPRAGAQPAGGPETLSARAGRLASEPGIGEGAARAALQGATFGFSDEAAGGLAGAAAGTRRLLTGSGPTAGEAYTAERDRERQRAAEFRGEHPWISGAAQIGGGIAGALAGGELLGAGRAAFGATGAAEAVPELVTAAERGILKSAGRGAVQGVKTAVPLSALAGAGTAEGGLADRARGALEGAKSGIVWGAGLGALGGAGVALAERHLDSTGLRPESEESPLAKAGIESAEGRALRQASRNLSGDAVDPEAVAARAKATKTPLTLADAGPEEGQVATSLKKAPGQTGARVGKVGEVLAARKADEIGRVKDALSETTGLPVTHTEPLAQTIYGIRTAQSRPLYEAAYQHGPISDPVINDLLETPYGAKALARGAKLAAGEQDPAFAPPPKDPNIEGARAMGIPEDQIAARFGADYYPPNVQKGYSVKALDYVKRGLDRQIRTLLRGGQKDEARVVQNVRGQLLARLDATVPEFKAARAAYASPSDLADALAEGTKHYDTAIDPRNQELALREMSPDQREMYRVGAIDQKIEDAGKAGHDASVADQFTGSPHLTAKTKLLFDDPEAARDFVGRMRDEKRMSATKGPSLGAGVTAGAADRPGGANFTPTHYGLIRSAARALINPNPSPGFLGKVGNATTDLLTAGAENPADLDAAVTRLGDWRARASQPSVVGPAVRSGILRQPGMQLLPAPGKSQPGPTAARASWDSLAARYGTARTLAELGPRP